MGQIPALLFEPIANLIGDIFTFGDLDGVLYKCSGQRTINAIANQDWPPRKVAFASLRQVDDDGTVKSFLAMLLEARPSRTDLRAKIVAALPELDAAARETQASVAQVVSSLKETEQGLRNPAVRNAVATSRGTIQAFAEGVDVLAAYKNLHDSLHQIQIRRFSDLPAATVAMASNPAQVEKLRDFQDRLRPCIPIARAAAAALPDNALLRATESSWIDKLETAAGKFKNGIDTSDSGAARVALAVVERILMREPSRLNGLIFLTAQRLPVQALIDGLDTAGKLDPEILAPILNIFSLLGSDAVDREKLTDWQKNSGNVFGLARHEGGKAEVSARARKYVRKRLAQEATNPIKKMIELEWAQALKIPGSDNGMKSHFVKRMKELVKTDGKGITVENRTITDWTSKWGGKLQKISRPKKSR